MKRIKKKIKQKYNLKNMINKLRLIETKPRNLKLSSFIVEKETLSKLDILVLPFKIIN